jgi:hypothetical protein
MAKSNIQSSQERLNFYQGHKRSAKKLSRREPWWPWWLKLSQQQ